MEYSIEKNLHPLRYGIVLSLITLLYGFGLGGAFGAFESNIKGYLKANAENVSVSVYHGDQAKIKKVSDKSWVYFKRAHLHANGLGATSIGLILLLSFLPIETRIKSINAIMIGLGSLGYALFWMFAGLKAPGMGSTHLAKESLKFIAVPSSGLCVVGLLMVIFFSVKTFFGKSGPES